MSIETLLELMGLVVIIFLSTISSVVYFHKRIAEIESVFKIEADHLHEKINHSKDQMREIYMPMSMCGEKHRWVDDRFVQQNLLLKELKEEMYALNKNVMALLNTFQK